MNRGVGQGVEAAVRADPAARRAVAVLRSAGGDVYAVGGVVRDVALGVEPHDVDLLVRLLSREDARDALDALPGHVSEVGKSFGILEYRCRDGCVQVSLPRLERSIGVHHRDFEITVDPQMPVEEDLARRDYTCNAVAVSLADGAVHDPLGGLGDIARGVARAVSMEVLAEDPLRIVRGLSLTSRRALTVDGETEELMRRSAGTVRDLPADRIHDELDRIMAGNDPVAAVRLAQRTGVLEHVLPEVAAVFGYDQNNRHHDLDLFEHTLEVLGEACSLTTDRDVRLAALLHDIGKPRSAWVDPSTGGSHYYEGRVRDDAGEVVETLGAYHEKVGAEMTRERMTALRYSLRRVNRVAALVRHHMWAPFGTKAGARRFLARVEDHADNLITIRRADGAGKSGPGDAHDPDVSQRLVDEVRAEESAFSRRDLAVDGTDLIELGVPAGPERARLLAALVDRVIDSPELNDRDTLRAMVTHANRGDGTMEITDQGPVA